MQAREAPEGSSATPPLVLTSAGQVRTSLPPCNPVCVCVCVSLGPTEPLDSISQRAPEVGKLKEQAAFVRKKGKHFSTESLTNAQKVSTSSAKIKTPVAVLLAREKLTGWETFWRAGQFQQPGIATPRRDHKEGGDAAGRSPALLVGIELHVEGVDGGVNHHPGAPPQLSMWGDVD